jgi:two-component system chemotaxis response regulator CheB
MIRVLVVDDSALMRRIVSRILSRDESIEVVGTAEDGEEAIEQAEALKPDVVTMDVEMPRMNGLEALRHIMSRNPLPVIMLSASTKEGAGITLDALNTGACDFVPKDLAGGTLNISRIEEELVRKVKVVAKRRIRSLPVKSDGGRAPLTFSRLDKAQHAIVAMGASTGGPPALHHILTSLPADFPLPIVIAQHMPKAFTQSFSERLNAVAQIGVKEAENGETLRPGTALVAPGDTHISVRRNGSEAVVEFVEDAKYVFRPSVDLLFAAIARIYAAKAIAVVLTGMGSDGLSGAREIKAAHGYVIAQDEETSAVYGMPKAVAEARLANSVTPVQRIAEEIMRVL